MTTKLQNESINEIEKLYRDFLRRGWLNSVSDRRLLRTEEDFLELAQMIQSAKLLVAHAFGASKHEKNEIFFRSWFGRLLSDLCDELHNLARSVKSEKLLPVGTRKPRNTSHPEKEAVTLIALNACAALIPHHKSKRDCFREVSELLAKHDTFLKPETIAKIWYARVKKIRTQGPPTGPNSYADFFIAFGGQESPSRGQPSHGETIDRLARIMGEVLPSIAADLRNAV